MRLYQLTVSFTLLFACVSSELRKVSKELATHPSKRIHEERDGFNGLFRKFLKIATPSKDESLKNSFGRLGLSNKLIKSNENEDFTETAVKQFLSSREFNDWVREAHSRKNALPRHYAEKMLKVLLQTYSDRDVALIIVMGKQWHDTKSVCEDLEAALLKRWKKKNMDFDKLVRLLGMTKSDVEQSDYLENIIHDYYEYMIKAKKLLHGFESIQSAFKKLILDKMSIKSTNDKINRNLVIDYFESRNFEAWMEYALKRKKQPYEEMYHALDEAFGMKDVALMIEIGKQNSEGTKQLCEHLEVVQFKRWRSNRLFGSRIVNLLGTTSSDIYQNTKSIERAIFDAYHTYLIRWNQ